MATETFSWTPDKEPTGTTTFRVKSAKFGDGYEQTAEDGINNKSESWPLTFTGQKAKIAQIKAFLNRHKGAIAFSWTEPFGENLLIKCKEYQSSNKGGSVYTLAATFEQAFHP
ncbi:phage tail protein [Pseudomonas sp. P115]|uniref:phage tail protein n=1 Tax=Pseudomonas pisciculturae TaxID=2730413 RepID=UPI0018927318|nr:phage tail protein [Pseudomonas pisciculturae]MBF6029680.1 phage tail protein [Pseudomonas pisciculturae]